MTHVCGTEGGRGGERQRSMGSRRSARRACLRRRRKRLAGGFTVVEVLIALVVLVVGFLGLVTLVYGGYSNVEEAGASSAAVATAESMVEFLRTQPAAVIPQMDRVTTADPTSCPGGAGSAINTACQAWLTRVGTLRQGRGTVAVATGPNAITNIPFHTVTVTIGWTEVGLGGRTVTVVTGITD